MIFSYRAIRESFYESKLNNLSLPESKVTRSKKFVDNRLDGQIPVILSESFYTVEIHSDTKNRIFDCMDDRCI